MIKHLIDDFNIYYRHTDQAFIPGSFEISFRVESYESCYILTTTKEFNLIIGGSETIFTMFDFDLLNDSHFIKEYSVDLKSSQEHVFFEDLLLKMIYVFDKEKIKTKMIEAIL